MKDVVYWVSEAWDNVREDTIRRSWRKLFGIEKASRQETAAPENQPRACPPENEELVNLCNHLPVAEPISAENISEWINGDEDQALTDDVIIQMLNQPEDDDNDEPDGATEKISHTEGLRTIEGALAYIEQQETATTNDLVWLRRWRNRAASLRSSNLSQKKQ
ncbi:tigger transposable element-derived protein 2-like [Homalodisca vitripennis]|uniref:tigger transposable element-derived protein 2-like n=1 Tax=Homalodisca vitripennis TaxID=197043 RepID=UPI001EEB185A|nr:tigger transposable element-derived protein 2-like [Homalodisca vitripennis]